MAQQIQKLQLQSGNKFMFGRQDGGRSIPLTTLLPFRLFNRNWYTGLEININSLLAIFKQNLKVSHFLNLIAIILCVTFLYFKQD